MSAASGEAAATARAPVTVDLDDPLALDPSVVGSKAANLARARRHRLPALPGVVVTTSACATLAGGDAAAEAAAGPLHAAWTAVSAGGTRPVVVRSSSPQEDGAASSMAGRFTSVLDVGGWEEFLDAVDAVLASACVQGGDGDSTRLPMAVLVQPHLVAAAGGVLFGADPVTGRADRLVVAVTVGGPDRLVQGMTAGTASTLSTRGRLLDADAGAAGLLPARRRRALARLAARAAGLFGAPQDIEWAVDELDRLWLLQSRPVTALPPAPGGPVLGPGPVAETFPDPMTPLEQDLWLAPLREAIVHALSLTGARSRRRLRTSPVVTAVGGRAAVDLALLGADGGEGALLRRLDPRPPARRLRAAWQTGRLHHALPGLARDVVGRVDAELSALPAVATLTTDELVAVLRGSRRALVAVHGHEILVGLLLRPASGGATAAGRGLEALAEARASGLGDGDIVAARPEVLALVPPAVRATTLPPPAAAPPPDAPRPEAGLGPRPGEEHDPHSQLREDLRLRTRWIQELSARAAWELGARLAAAGRIERPELVRWLTLAELEAVMDGDDLPGGLAARCAEPPGPPLPAAFRLAPDGTVVAVASGGRRRVQGEGAGGGRGVGPVAHADGQPHPGAVLVVATLEPALAALLPGLAGLVAETGSVLSHLAILAREMGVPTVVGVPGAAQRFPPGVTVLVDGTSGRVQRLEDHDQQGRP